VGASFPARPERDGEEAELVSGSSPTLRRTRRIRPHAGGLSVIHLVCPEIAVLAVVVAALVSARYVVPAAAAAIVVLLLVFGRTRGRWWFEYAAARWRLGQRRRSGARALVRLAGADPRAAAMATLRPGLTIRNLLHRGRSIGIGADSEGWFAAVAVASWADVTGSRNVRLDLDQLARIVEESPVPISTLQVVSHLTQAPVGLAENPARRSYLELAAPGGCPLDQAVWLVVRLAPADAVEAAASRGGGLDGVDRALAAMVSRVEKALAAAGVTGQVLDADGLGDALALACGLDALDAPRSGQPLAGERWSTWLGGGTAHACFTVTQWPNGIGHNLLAALAAVPASAVGLSVTLHQHGSEVAFLGLVRVAAPPAQLSAAVTRLTATSRRIGLRLRRLDGDQARGVYATAPTGGTS
jgi:type VII secretion protein EccE